MTFEDIEDNQLFHYTWASGKGKIFKFLAIKNNDVCLDLLDFDDYYGINARNKNEYFEGVIFNTSDILEIISIEKLSLNEYKEQFPEYFI